MSIPGLVEMDPLSITASVIAVIGLAGKIISLCQGYVNTMKGAPSDLRTIMVETGSLKSVVRSLEFLLSSWGPGDLLCQTCLAVQGGKGS